MDEFSHILDHSVWMERKQSIVIMGEHPFMYICKLYFSKPNILVIVKGTD